MDASVWLARNEGQLGSDYERIFVEQVLTRVRELDFRALSAQYGFRDDVGKPRYCDFVIQEGDGVRIAIEVDGYNKTGNRSGMSHPEFLDWQRRHASLVAQGWRVIRFANVDVRDNAQRCSELLTLLLRDERSKESHSRSLEQRILELEAAQQKRVAEERASYGQERQELEQLKTELAKARQTPKLSQEESKRLEELERSQRQIKLLEQETSIVKTTIWAFTLLLVVALVLVFQSRGPSGDQTVPTRVMSQSPEPQVAAAPVPVATPAQPAPSLTGSSCAQPLPWTMAREHVGKVVAISGPVARVAVRDDVRGKPVFVTIGQTYPSRQRVDLVIWEGQRSKFLPLLEQGLEGRDVCVFTEVGQRDGVPQLVLRSRNDLQLR